MAYDTILLEQADGVATITLNRPAVLNAFDDQMAAEVQDALKVCERDAAVRCLLVTGAGRGFSAGQDLAAIQSRGAELSYRDHLSQNYNPIVEKMRRMEKPILGAVNGVAAGMGMSLALACDLRIASDKASFIQSFVNVGLVPDSGSSFFLVRTLGLGRAFELAATGERVSAEDALRLGLVNRVVPHDDLLPLARAWAGQLAGAPTRALGLIKRMMNRALVLDVEEALAYEAMLQEAAGRTADHHEGVAAFLEKRKPVFSGK